MDRRSLLAAALASPVVIAAPVAAFTAADDAALISAWNERTDAYRSYAALPSDSTYQHQHPLLARIDAAEEVIHGAIAKTPLGTEIQMWTAFSHVLSGSDEDDAAILRRDLAYFETKQPDLDWDAAIMVSAIRSLRRSMLRRQYREAI